MLMGRNHQTTHLVIEVQLKIWRRTLVLRTTGQSSCSRTFWRINYVVSSSETVYFGVWNTVKVNLTSNKNISYFMLKRCKICTLLKLSPKSDAGFDILMLFTSWEGQIYSLKCCRVTKILVPSGVHAEGRWAHTGPDALQRMFKIFHLDVAHLSDK